MSGVVYEFHFPPRDPVIRERLEQELDRDGVESLLQRLRVRDPEAAARVDPRNGRRVIRALEVVEQGSATHGATLPVKPTLWHPRTRLIGLHVDRSDLVARLDARVRRMWEHGLVAEVARLRDEGLERGTTAPRAIGYAQALAQLEGRSTAEEAIAETQALTRRYARRQVSWFKRYPELEWMAPPVAVADLLAP